jgi:hypothetical protein
MALDRPMRLLALTAAVALLACQSGTYDWTPTQTALARSLPPGLSLDRAVAVLDSMGFSHSPATAGDTLLIASKREPASHQLVFSTLRVIVPIAPSQSIGHVASRVVFTGP